MLKNFIKLLVLLLITNFLSCKNSIVEYPSTIRFDSIRNILLNSVELYASLNMENDITISSTGFCWNTSSEPTLDNSYCYSKDIKNINSIIINLKPDTKYYLRAFTRGIAGTCYSKEMSFTTWNGKLTDIDGNIYKGIQIGNQGWMAENLRTTHYSDGTEINTMFTSNKFYWYGEGKSYLSLSNADLDKDGDIDTNDGKIYVKEFGLLYTGYAAVNLYSSACNGWVNKKVTNNCRDICPSGWHVPTSEEWVKLINFVQDKSQLLKSDSLWYTNNGTNACGFNALPGGVRESDGDFDGLYNSTVYHCSTQSYGLSLYANKDYISYLSGGGNARSEAAIPVRCIKDK